jgi:hypothetical protein
MCEYKTNLTSVFCRPFSGVDKMNLKDSHQTQSTATKHFAAFGEGAGFSVLRSCDVGYPRMLSSSTSVCFCWTKRKIAG